MVSYEKPRFLIKHNECVVREIFEKILAVNLKYPLYELDQCVIKIDYKK